jgi:hypothetical protein
LVENGALCTVVLEMKILVSINLFVMSAPTPLLTKASVTIFLVLLKVLSLVDFIVEDACVGDFL